MDRVGPTRPLLLFAALFAVAVAALVAAVRDGPAAAGAGAARAGQRVDPAGDCAAASRALWGVLLPPGPRPRRGLHLRGDQPGGLLHHRPGLRRVPGAGALARHRAGGGRGGDGARRGGLRAQPPGARPADRPTADVRGRAARRAGPAGHAHRRGGLAGVRGGGRHRGGRGARGDGRGRLTRARRGADLGLVGDLGAGRPALLAAALAASAAPADAGAARRRSRCWSRRWRWSGRAARWSC